MLIWASDANFVLTNWWKQRGREKKLHSELIWAAPASILLIALLSICVLSCNLTLLPDTFKYL